MNDETKAIITIIRHRDMVRANIQNMIQDLERRALNHDLSKLAGDECEGFVRINKAAREHPYGSKEYKDSMESEKGPTGCIGLHYSRNSHHPEYHAKTHWECGGCHRATEEEPQESCPVCGYSFSCKHEDLSGMGFLDIIEMVLDWKAAADTYGKSTLRGGLVHQRERFKFSVAQWWLIEQVVDYIEPRKEGE
jgi:rubrerythrin